MNASGRSRPPRRGQATTAHAPSKWTVAREQLGDDHDVDALVETHGRIDAVLREFDVPPPALTTECARSRLQTQDLGRHSQQVVKTV